MKKNQLYFFIFALLTWDAVLAQGTSSSFALSFPDSVRIVLENTRNVDAEVVGSGFASIWDRLGADHQRAIREQTYQMRKKKYGLRPYLVHYYGSLVNAVNIEQLDSKTMTEYLRVAGKVIENQSSAAALYFFQKSRSFFEHHALHYEKSYRLYARDDQYSFDYIEPPKLVSWDEIGQLQNESPEDSDGVEEQAPEPVDDNAESDEADSYTDDQYDAGSYEEQDPWMQSTPPPVLEGPVIQFDQLTLNFATLYDSVFLTSTKGKLSLLKPLFIGEGGNFDWTSGGLSPDSLTCTMTTYHFDVSKCDVGAEVVKLNYLGRTPGFIVGTFEFKSQPRADSVLSSYPRFVSYKNDLKISGIGDDNVEYVGGFSLAGRAIGSKSFTGGTSTIRVSSKGSLKFVAESSDFQITSSSIKSDNARIRLYQRGDSIAHSLVRMRYAFGSDSVQHLLLLKDKGEMRNAPYSSSYFNIDFTADIVRWDLLSDSLDFRTDGARDLVPMIIESVDFYDIEDYRLLRGSGFTFHPLTVFVNYYLRTGYREFYAGDLEQFTGRNVTEMRAAAGFLAQKGLIFYDRRSDKIVLKDKAIALFQAFQGKQDYDNLKIHSVIDSTANATINFNEGYMTVRGVEEFNVSDSLNVRIKPDSSVITLLKDRDMKFDGTITAGKFEISGKGFTLKYDSFYISMSHIDSINFYVTEKNARGQEVRRKVNNSMVGADSTAAAAGGLGDISQSSGTLFISKGNNKSGKEKLPNFPRLDASTGGVIYFDRRDVLNGAYDRSMFFVVPPFKLDSLNDADPASINFDGTFVSSGMFPSFKDKLRTQPDKSLGFTHGIPSAGYQLYQGDGKMTGGLQMNNRGLRGMGTIEYLAAHISSDDFIFYPDSVITQGTGGRIEPKQFGAVKFPQASLPSFDFKWYPKEDRMKLKNLQTPFNFYDSTAQMLGTLTLSKKGVFGMGKLTTRGTELISREMNFTETDFSARHARFRVLSDDPNKNLLAGNDIRLKFNLKQNYADLSPEIEGVAAIDFPYAQFKTSIPNARWNLDDQKIVMSKDPNTPIESSIFYTTRKDLDSLRFYAERAEYDLKSQQLKVSGIPDIVVADARITPENNEVLILENARIGTLKNTTIIIDTLNGYHRLTEGVVDIISRNEFRGYATYQYVNFLNDTFAIKMTDFHLEQVAQTDDSRRKRNSVATMQTVATGSVVETDSLILGAGMFYKGAMNMYATRPALELDGYIKLDIRKIKNYKTWIRYTQTGDETDVAIPFDNALTEEGRRADAGLHFSSTDNSLYISFLNDKRNDDDDDFFVPSGTLFYDTEAKEYKIEDKEKAAGNKLSGKVFAYSDLTSQVRFEGPVKLFNGSKNFNINATMIGNGNLETNEIRMNSLLAIDTDIPSTAFQIMAMDLVNVITNEGAAEGLGDQTELLYKIADIVGEDYAKDYETKSLQGYVSLSTLPALVKPLVISDVNLRWSDKHKAFYSEGNIGISNSFKTDINGGFEGFLEVKKNEDGSSSFHLFFKASPESWYYFGFEDNRLLVFSSNADFNSVIVKRSTAGKAKVGEVAFLPGTEDETLAFINRFRTNYYGIQVPYSLHDGSQAVQKKADEKKADEDDGF